MIVLDCIKLLLYKVTFLRNSKKLSRRTLNILEGLR